MGQEVNKDMRVPATRDHPRAPSIAVGVLRACLNPQPLHFAIQRPPPFPYFGGYPIAPVHIHTPHLVRAVEEGQKALLLHHLQHAAPLLRGGVHAGGVVRAGVQQHHRAWGPGMQARGGRLWHVELWRDIGERGTVDGPAQACSSTTEPGGKGGLGRR